MPIGLCDRIHVVDTGGSASHFALGIEFARKMVKSSLGSEVYALSEMVDRILLLRDFYWPFKTERMIAEGYSVHHFLSIRQALDEGDLGNAYWLPGAENPADGLTKVRSDMVPLLRLLESGLFCLGQLWSLRGVAQKERLAHVTHRN